MGVMKMQEDEVPTPLKINSKSKLLRYHTRLDQRLEPTQTTFVISMNRSIKPITDEVILMNKHFFFTFYPKYILKYTKIIISKI